MTTAVDGNNGSCSPSLCSLRDAVNASNADSGGDTISVPPGTYRLTQGALELTTDVTIEGQLNQAEATIVDGLSLNRVFIVDNGVTATIQDVKVRGGLYTVDFGQEAGGGGILNEGTLTLTRDVVAGNAVTETVGGGGIYNTGDLTLDATTVRNNITQGRGAGINNALGATLDVTDGSVITANMGEVDEFPGGGIYNDGAATVDGSSVSHNFGGSEGGGIYNDAAGALTVTNSHIDSNSSFGAGAGLYLVSGSTASVTSSSVNGNAAASGDGGGIYNNASTVVDAHCDADDTSGCGLTLLDTTVDHNASHSAGGGIASQGSLSIDGGSVDGNSAAGQGGAIYSIGVAILSDTEVDGNAASNDEGGGIYGDGSLLSLTDTTVDRNMADGNGAEGGGGIASLDTEFDMTDGSVSGNSTTSGNGGGLYLDNPGETSADLSGVEIANNSSAGAGGGIYNTGDLSMTGGLINNNSVINQPGAGVDNAGTASLVGVAVRHNMSDGDLGGGLANEASATLTVTHSAIDGNVVNGDGGGISNFGTLTLTASSVTDNIASLVGGGLHEMGTSSTLTNDTFNGNVAATSGQGEGGGIYKGTNGDLSLTNVTISANQALVGDGGGIYVDNGQLSPSAVNTIIAGNEGGDCNAAITDNGHNIDGDGSCLSDDGTDPLLAPPAVDTSADATNITSTQGLRSGSLAIDNGDDTACPDVDQRGAARAHDGSDHCDIGAFEGTVGNAPGPPSGVTYTVNTTADDNGSGTCADVENGDCTLRDAVTQANAHPGSTIGVPAGVYTIAGQLNITQSMTITGVGAGETVIDAGQGSRVIYIGAISTPISVTISDLTVRNGLVSSHNGAGIYLNANDTVTLSGDVVSDNASNNCDEGAGIYNTGGTLHVQGGTIVRNNTTCGDGGGIWNGGGGVATVTGSSAVTGNLAGDGGGIYSNSPDSGGSPGLSIVDSSIDNNVATSFGDGGGVYIGSGGTANIDPEQSGTSVSGNAAYEAGGIYNDGTLTVTSSSVSDNETVTLGGGIYNDGSLTLDTVTLDGNTATQSEQNGGGLYNEGDASITDGSVSANTAYNAGGGIFNDGTGLTIDGATFQSDVADSAGGGAIYTDATTQVVNNSEVNAPVSCEADICLTGVDISGNTGYDAAGGLYVFDGVVTVDGSSISHNHAAEGNGGGVYNESTLTLTDTNVDGNNAYDGAGGIYNDDSLEMTGGSVSNNIATNQTAGGLWNDGGSASLTTVTVNGNASAGDEEDGGGIYNESETATATLTVDDSSLSGNITTGGGGGLAVGSGDATITKTEISRNTALDSGGGVYEDDTLTLVNSTVSGNATNSDGGGVYSEEGTTSNLSNDTVTDNRAGPQQGGGLYSNAATSNVGNTIVADNTQQNCSGSAATDLGHNLEAPASAGEEPNTSCGFTAGSDVLVADAGLTPLALNAPGDTQTHALKANSAAVDAGDNTICAATTANNGANGVDQRGVTRPQGSRCDIGAYELVNNGGGGGGGDGGGGGGGGTPSADLKLVKTASATTVAPGDPIVYHLTVTNNGPSASSGFTITDVLPAGETFTSATTGCTQSSGTVTCTSTTPLANAASTSYDVTVTAPATEQTVTNTAKVKGIEADPDSTNDTSSVDVTVQKSSGGGGGTCQTTLTLHKVLTFQRKTRHDGVHRQFRLFGKLTPVGSCSTGNEWIYLFRSSHLNGKGTRIQDVKTRPNGSYSFVVWSRENLWYYHTVFVGNGEILPAVSTWISVPAKK